MQWEEEQVMIRVARAASQIYKEMAFQYDGQQLSSATSRRICDGVNVQRKNVMVEVLGRLIEWLTADSDNQSHGGVVEGQLLSGNRTWSRTETRHTDGQPPLSCQTQRDGIASRGQQPSFLTTEHANMIPGALNITTAPPQGLDDVGGLLQYLTLMTSARLLW
ncbi:hypothetical protein BaRGS_00008703 [Batillaria attramentaria]|uniref:Uncharacterized protein n=1 Tax=Batillaria attramentaria TaxID=370345 RepID=A0ABD0LKT6_9CAEN